MILLERKAPRSIEKLETLLRRLPPSDDDFTFFNDKLHRIKIGYEGEKKVDREWYEMPYLGKHYLLFNFETVNEFDSTHQMDTVLLTARFLILLEIKNITGEVEYNPSTHQFIRKKSDGKKESLQNPYDQIARHTEFLQRLLKKLNMPLPIEGAIIMANQNTIIGDVPPHPPLFHASGLRTFVKHCQAKHQPNITEQQLQKLAKHLLAIYKPIEFDLNIGVSRLRKGVLCPNCHPIPLTYKNGVWICPKCGTRNKQAFYQALNDYRILIDNRITNHQFREFFGVESVFAASKILSRLNLESFGTTRSKYYLIPEEILNRNTKKST